LLNDGRSNSWVGPLEKARTGQTNQPVIAFLCTRTNVELDKFFFVKIEVFIFGKTCTNELMDKHGWCIFHVDKDRRLNRCFIHATRLQRTTGGNTVRCGAGDDAVSQSEVSV
jgi:hypothetical protein